MWVLIVLAALIGVGVAQAGMLMDRMWVVGLGCVFVLAAACVGLYQSAEARQACHDAGGVQVESSQTCVRPGAEIEVP